MRNSLLTKRSVLSSRHCYYFYYCNVTTLLLLLQLIEQQLVLSITTRTVNVTTQFGSTMMIVSLDTFDMFVTAQRNLTVINS